MSKEAVFTMKLESEPRDEFRVETAQRAALQIVFELMRQLSSASAKSVSTMNFCG